MYGKSHLGNSSHTTLASACWRGRDAERVVSGATNAFVVEDYIITTPRHDDEDHE